MTKFLITYIIVNKAVVFCLCHFYGAAGSNSAARICIDTLKLLQKWARYY